MFLGLGAMFAVLGMALQFTWLKNKHIERDEDDLIYRLN